MKYYLFSIVVFILVGCNIESACDSGYKRNGQHTEYYRNGNVKYVTSLKGCYCNGISKYYYPNGNLKLVGQCITGKRNGKWEHFSDNNIHNAISQWKNGKMEKFTILLSNGENVVFDSNRDRIFNTKGKNVLAPYYKNIFNESSQIRILPNSKMAIMNYSQLIVLSESLDVLFDINKIKDTLFSEPFSKRTIIHSEEDESIKDGLDYSIGNDSLSITVYFRSPSNELLKKSKFSFSIAE